MPIPEPTLATFAACTTSITSSSFAAARAAGVTAFTAALSTTRVPSLPAIAV